jgi:hypothetical protein
MALKKTQLLDITTVTGINTVGIFTVGVTPTAGGVGVASTSYIKNVIMHNTGLGTCRVSLFINPNTANANALGYGVTANRFMRIDLAPNETTFFESTYPIVMTDRDSLSVEITTPENSGGGSGIGSAVNFIVNGDTDV